MSKRALPDPRRHAYRGDLASEALRGQVDAPRYIQGELRQVTAPVLPLRREPRFDSTLDTEALLGETVTVYDESEGWAWVQIARDSYVGYMPSEGLGSRIVPPTHRIAALRTYIFPQPDSKSPPLALLSLNALISASGMYGKFLALASGGFVYAPHVVPVGETAADFVAVAEAFLGTPYLWGGRTSVGLDCSGLVQLAAEAVGIVVPRDADMQAAEIGERVESTRLRRGDLVFWEGHVGIMTSGKDFLHANAHHMAVELEPFDQAKDRIKAAGYDMLCVRRLPGRPKSR
ncbi:MAG: C40 family peptidase [Methyloceanibacter sp.]|uniref:C40 family peptidase n=1 Tax=Methyloceanibacter sp. TaxID=1965321 RepID=UPI003D9BF3D0